MGVCVGVDVGVCVGVVGVGVGVSGVGCRRVPFPGRWRHETGSLAGCEGRRPTCVTTGKSLTGIVRFDG